MDLGRADRAPTPSGETEYSRAPSPDEELEVVLRSVSEGAATRSMRLAFVVARGVPDSVAELVLEVCGGGKMHVDWQTPKILRISVRGSASVGFTRTRVSKYGLSIIAVVGEQSGAYHN